MDRLINWAEEEHKDWGFCAMMARQEISIYVTALPLDNEKVQMCICEVDNFLNDIKHRDSVITPEQQRVIREYKAEVAQLYQSSEKD